MASERYKLTVVGGAGKEISGGTNVAVLAQKARDLALQGYTACIKNRQGSIVELRRDGADSVALTYRRAPQDITWRGDGEAPWVQAVRNVLSHS